MAAPSEEKLICDKFNLEALTVNIFGGKNMCRHVPKVPYGSYVPDYINLLVFPTSGISKSITGYDSIN
jgi:hypothetical protein